MLLLLSNKHRSTGYIVDDTIWLFPGSHTFRFVNYLDTEHDIGGEEFHYRIPAAN